MQKGQVHRYQSVCNRRWLRFVHTIHNEPNSAQNKDLSEKQRVARDLRLVLRTYETDQSRQRETRLDYEHRPKKGLKFLLSDDSERFVKLVALYLECEAIQFKISVRNVGYLLVLTLYPVFNVYHLIYNDGLLDYFPLVASFDLCLAD